MNSTIGHKYQITKKIGAGSFGEIYQGIGQNNEKVYIYYNLLWTIVQLILYVKSTMTKYQIEWVTVTKKHTRICDH